jgi:hypothetical protein
MGKVMVGKGIVRMKFKRWNSVRRARSMRGYGFV